MASIAATVINRAATYLNMKTIVGRLERRGHMRILAEGLMEAKRVEEVELKEELEGDIDTFRLCTNVFKDNLKLILGLIVDELWADREERQRNVKTKVEDKEEYEEQSNSFIRDKGNDIAQEGDSKSIAENEDGFTSKIQKSRGLLVSNISKRKLSTLRGDNSASTKEKKQHSNNIIYVHIIL